MMIDVQRGIMEDNRPPFSFYTGCYDSILPDLYGLEHKIKVRKFPRDESASNQSKFVHTPSVKAISWLTSLSLVEFGVTSEVGPYSSSIFM